jgi:uncharacterized protein (UPF0548 family)
MNFQLFFPTETRLESLKADQKDKPFSYPQINGKREGYIYDNHVVLLGEGTELFEAAQRAVKQWAMFPNTWASIHHAHTPLEVGRVVIMCARVMGLWCLYSQ